MTDRRVPQPSSSDPSPSTAEVARLDLEGWHKLLEDGEATSAELVETLLRQVDDLNTAGPGIRAVLAVNERALDEARRLDAERHAGRTTPAGAGGQALGPLHGIPVLVKDNIDTPAPLGTTAGSLALASPDCQPRESAPLVRRLAEAGAIVLGKANLSEWANFRSTHSSSGWSAVGGQCRNPHVLDRSPGGSSSGSGAGVAAGLAPLAIGTETDGSILCPATVCGVVGLKPTLGRVPTAGVVPISPSQDVAGPFARSVADAAALFAVLAGAPRPDLSAGGLERARIGVARGRCFGYSTAADAAVERALEVMAEAGAEIVDPAPVETADELAGSEDELTVLLHEFKASLEAYLAGRPGPPAACPRTLAELAAFDEAQAESELAFFGHELVLDAAKTDGLDAPRYREARARCLRLAREQGLDATFERHQLDALVAPTMGPSWPIDLVNGDPHLGGCSQMSAVAGYPALTMPAGEAHGLPLGICFMGRAGSDETLLRLAFALEQALGAGAFPSFRQTVAP